VINILDYPPVLFLATLCLMVFSVWLGGVGIRRVRTPNPAFRDDFTLILSGTLTLLALIIGFTVSMATIRYDQRKNLEEEEANAIGTEFVRADLLPAADAAMIRTLLREYYDQRILFYTVRDTRQIMENNARTAELQKELWSAASTPAATDLRPAAALVVSGMNDVLNSQGYAQAAAWNRIPAAVWLLMVMIAVFCHLLIGLGARDARAERALLVIMPLITAMSFLLIADIDSPRGGVIRIYPDNLSAISESLR
jgi:hypothetical protein